MKFLVTAGPTREHIDSVRYLSNASSGFMGFSIASQAAIRGHGVVLVSGPVQLSGPLGVERIDVTSAQEMFDEVTARFHECHCVVMTGAVCDYRVAEPARKKLPKSRRGLHLDLVPTPDILAHLGRTRTNQVLIGFALEDHDARAHAEAKLIHKGCHAIVLNAPSNAGSTEGQIEILRRDGGWSGPYSGAKTKLAATILDLAEDLAAVAGGS